MDDIRSLIEMINQLKENDPDAYNELMAGLGITKQEPEEEKEEMKIEEMVEKTVKKSIESLLKNLPVKKQDEGEKQDANADALDRIEAVLDEATVEGIEEITKSNEIEVAGETKFQKSFNGLFAIVKANHAAIGELTSAFGNFIEKSGIGEQLAVIEKQKEEEEEKKKEQEEIEKNAKQSEVIAKAVAESIKGVFKSSNIPGLPTQIPEKLSPAANVRKSIDDDFITKLRSMKKGGAK
jgi:hypothetical protein